MKNLLYTLLLFFFSIHFLSASSYIDSKEFLEVSSLKEINELIEENKEDYKAFFLLDDKMKEESDLVVQDAMILKGWLSYHYSRYTDAIEAWQIALDLSQDSHHSWVNLWLSWVYLREGDILKSLNSFKGIKQSDIKDAQDENLYMTLKNRLTYFPLPIKENPKLYLDFISLIEPYNEFVYLGNIYGGIACFDMLNSQIVVLEKSIPSMKGNPIFSFVSSEVEEAPYGFFYSDKEGIFFVSYKEEEKKKKLPSLPVKSEKSNFIIDTILWGGDLVVHFSKEGLWVYRTFENKWELITKDIRENSFLFKDPYKGKNLLFLDKESHLTSILWLSQMMGDDPFTIESVILDKDYFKPAIVNLNEFWLATRSGDLYQITFSNGEGAEEEYNPIVTSIREGSEEDNWLAFWRGENSGLLNVINQQGFWQRIDFQGNIINSKKFVVPILSNLIHHYAVGRDYTYLNIASEVYAVNEELFFNQ